MRQRVVVLMAVILSGFLGSWGCARSHGVGGDAAMGPFDGTLNVDAGGLDAEMGTVDGGNPTVAPRCEASPATRCMMLHLVSTLAISEELGAPDIRATPLSGLAYLNGPALLHAHRDPDAPGNPVSPASWMLTRWRADGTMTLASTRISAAQSTDMGWGSGLSASGDLLMAVYRQGRYEPIGPVPTEIGYDVFAADIDSDVRVRGPLLTTGAAAEGSGRIAVAGQLAIVSGPHALRVVDIHEERELYSIATGSIFFDIRAAMLDAERMVIAWSEDHGRGLGHEISTEIAIVDRFSVHARQRVFWPSPLAETVSILANESGIWVARYDTDASDLRASRIRVARLNELLDRVEPDRWLSGWGGLVPGGMSIVGWRERPWLVFRTLDPRFGANPVLYIRALADAPCGYDVMEPAAIWPPIRIAGNLLATAGDGALWIAVAYASGPGTVDLYRVDACD